MPSAAKVRVRGLVLRIEILGENTVHGKHVNLVLLENGPHGFVAAYLALVGWILQIPFPYVFPYLFDSLWPRELNFIVE